MIIYEFRMIAGFRISEYKLYKLCLRESEKLRDYIKKYYNHYIDAYFTFDEFFNFISSHESYPTLPRRGKGQEPTKEELMIETASDSAMGCLHEIKYPGTDLEMYPITHDVDKSGDYIVGVVLTTIKIREATLSVSSLDEFSQHLSNAKSKLTSLGIKDHSIYMVQDDCACCS